MIENEFTATRPFHAAPKPARTKEGRMQQMIAIAEQFPVGSLAQHGPFVKENAPQIMRVIPYDAYVDGDGHNAPDESYESVGWCKTLGGLGHYGAFFVATTVLSTPFSGVARGKTQGNPPATLTPMTGAEVKFGFDPGAEPGMVIVINNFAGGVDETTQSIIDGLETALDMAERDRNRLSAEVTRLKAAREDAHTAGVREGRQQIRDKLRNI